MTSACTYLLTVLYMKIKVCLSVQHVTNLKTIKRTVICGLGLGSIAHHIAPGFPFLEAHAIDIIES